MGRPARRLIVLAALLFAACGGQGGDPPVPPPKVKAADGQEYHLVARGSYRALYDPWGRLQRLEQDSNGDGQTDRAALYQGERSPRVVEVDVDFDRATDRWEEYDGSGRLYRIGASRRGGRPDTWIVVEPGTADERREYDEDGDGRVDRRERLEGGTVVTTESDSNRDGRMDRWQRWSGGQLSAEDVDSDRDGLPDLRLAYSGGRVTSASALAR
jgi:hypothetical protein